MADEAKIKVDMAGFEAKMEESRQKSRAAGKAKGAKDMSLKANETDKLITGMKPRVPRTCR